MEKVGEDIGNKGGGDNKQQSTNKKTNLKS